jgi:hypothetical protein
MLEQILHRSFHDAKIEWQVEIKIYEGLQNPKWYISQKIANKLVKIFNSLPTYKKGIPNAEENRQLGCFVYNEKGSLIIANGDYVIGLRKNIIEVKMDGLDIIKNEILRTCPADLYRNVSNLFQDFRTKTEDINPITNEIVKNSKRVKIWNHKT